MRRRILLVLGLVLVLGVTASQGEWTMWVHRGGTRTGFLVSGIDSLTFRDDTLSIPGMAAVPAGVFTMGDGVAICGTDQRQVTLTHDFYLGQHEVTNLEYLEAVQWAYDQGYVTASENYRVEDSERPAPDRYRCRARALHGVRFP